MKKKHVIAIATISAALAAATTIYFMEKKRRERRRAFVANAGYETAYDVHYPVRYSRNKGKATKN